MSDPQSRISEFLRQYKMGSGQHPKDIAGVYKDLDSTMAMLTVTDLEALVDFVEGVRLALLNSKTFEGVVHDIGDRLETLDDTE